MKKYCLTIYFRVRVISLIMQTCMLSIVIWMYVYTYSYAHICTFTDMINSIKTSFGKSKYKGTCQIWSIVWEVKIRQIAKRYWCITNEYNIWYYICDTKYNDSIFSAMPNIQTSCCSKLNLKVLITIQQTSGKFTAPNPKRKTNCKVGNSPVEYLNENTNLTYWSVIITDDSGLFIHFNLSRYGIRQICWIRSIVDFEFSNLAKIIKSKLFPHSHCKHNALCCTITCLRYTWWHHQMETFSALLGFVREISQRPVTQSFDVFFVLRLNKRLSKQSRRRGFETLSRLLWRHCNACYICRL